MEDVDLVNVALREVGAGAIAAIDDTTPEGAIAGDIYTFKRDLLLRAHPWNFAMVRAPLGRSLVFPGSRFAYAYRMPSDWMRTVEVNDSSSGRGAVEYRQESIWINERITNGDFDEDASWTKGTGWTISGGKASHAAGTGSDLSQTTTIIASHIFRVFFTVLGRSAGTLTPKLTGGTTVLGLASSADGQLVQEITAHSAGNTALTLTASSDFDGSVDDVSVVDLSGTLVPVIATDATDVYLRYVRKVTVVDQMTPGFQQALVSLMAKLFATGLASSNSLRQLNDVDLRSAIALARSIDGIEDYPERVAEGSWATSRYGGGWRRGSVWAP